MKNRSRFLILTIKAVRERVQSSFCVSVKLNSADFQKGGFNVEDAMDLADASLLASAESIVVRSIAGQPYDRIIKYRLSEIPNITLEEAPF